MNINIKGWQGALLILGLAGTALAGEPLRLPPGDPVAGRTTFIAAGCASCHRAKGQADLPDPVADPVIGVELAGGRSEAALITAILHPSDRIRPGTTGTQVAGGSSRMGTFSDALTVRELLDLVAFLRSLPR